jgi:hypothetical protein
MSLLLNAVAFGTHGDVGNVYSLAGKLGTTSGRLRPMLRKLAQQGYVTIERDIGENVYPTMAALRWQDPKLSEREAKAGYRGYIVLEYQETDEDPRRASPKFINQIREAFA